MKPKTQLSRNSWITAAASFAVVAGLALLPGRAGATIFNYGPQSSDLFYGQFKPTGSFLDQIQFSVASPFTVTLRDNFTTFSLVAGLNATLYNSAGVAVYSGLPNTPSLSQSFVNLVPSTPLLV